MKKVRKAFTTIEQSKMLEEILPQESSDSYYWCADHYPKEDWIWEFGEPDTNYECIRAWTLSALLDILPRPSLHKTRDGKWDCMAEPNRLYFSEYCDNPVDTCYEMVIKLHDLNLL